MSASPMAEVARNGQSVKDSLFRLYVQESMKNPLFLEQVKQIEKQMEGIPKASLITGNKTLDAFVEYLLRRTLATAEEDDDGTVVFTPSSSAASAFGTEAQDSQAAREDENTKKKGTTASFAGMLAKLLGIKAATSTPDGNVDEAQLSNEINSEVIAPVIEVDSDKTTTPSKHAGNVFLGPDFKADLVKTAAFYLILDLVILTPTDTGLRARFVATLIIFTLMKLNTLSKLEESMENTANDKASLEKEGAAVSCQALIAMGIVVKLAFFS